MNRGFWLWEVYSAKRRTKTGGAKNSGGVCRQRRYSSMKIVAAVLLAALGGNTSPSADDIKGILGSVGIDGDDERIDLLLGQLKGRDLVEVIAAGREKFASVPSGGGVAVAVASGGGGAAATAAAPEAEAKKEEKVEEKEESDDDMGFSLFD